MNNTSEAGAIARCIGVAARDKRGATRDASLQANLRRGPAEPRPSAGRVQHSPSTRYRRSRLVSLSCFLPAHVNERAVVCATRNSSALLWLSHQTQSRISCRAARDSRSHIAFLSGRRERTVKWISSYLCHQLLIVLVRFTNVDPLICMRRSSCPP